MPFDDTHPLYGNPLPRRIDIAIAIALAMEHERGLRLPVDVIADIAGCSDAAIYARRKAALDKLKRTASRDAELLQFFPRLKPQA